MNCRWCTKTDSSQNQAENDNDLTRASDPLTCSECQQVLSSVKALKYHMSAKHPGVQFISPNERRKQLRERMEAEIVKCCFCNEDHPRSHMVRCPQRKKGDRPRDPAIETEGIPNPETLWHLTMECTGTAERRRQYFTHRRNLKRFARSETLLHFIDDITKDLRPKRQTLPARLPTSRQDLVQRLPIVVRPGDTDMYSSLPHRPAKSRHTDHNSCRRITNTFAGKAVAQRTRRVTFLLHNEEQTEIQRLLDNENRMIDEMVPAQPTELDDDDVITHKNSGSDSDEDDKDK